MFEIGTATDYQDLADKLNTFLTAKGSAFGLTYAGVGTGTLTAYAGGASSVAETFTITATSSTSFSVVGSVTGSIGPATVGTPFAHAKLSFLLTAGGTAFVAGDAFQIATAPKWTLLRGPATATSTAWRIRVIDTVGGVGSNVEIGEMELMDTHGGPNLATGGTASASSGTTAASAFDGSGATRAQLTGNSGWLQYTLASTKAIKEFAITMSSATGTMQAAPKNFALEYFDGTNWIIVGSFRNETAWTVGERRVFRLVSYIWQAPGNDGVSQILSGLHLFENAGTGWYNWRLNGFTAYDASSDFFSQPGSIKTSSPYGPVLPLSNGAIGYWFTSSGRGVRVQVKVGSVYGGAYLGLLQPYASPGQWPYPLFIGGSLYFAPGNGEPASNSTDWLVGSTPANHTCYPMSYFELATGNATDFPTSGSGRLRKPDGSWLGVLGRSTFYDLKTSSPCGTTHPYSNGFNGLKPDLDGKYSLFPIILMERGPDNIYGQLDGVQAVTGSGLSPEATITVDPLPSALPGNAQTWVAFPDVSRNGPGDYCAVRLD